MSKENALRPEERAYLRLRLQQKLAELEENLHDLRKDTAPISPDDSYGRVSRMDAIGAKGVREAALRESENLKVALDEALARLSRSDFGLCINCGKSITIKRLLVKPSSRRCIACAN